MEGATLQIDSVEYASRKNNATGKVGRLEINGELISNRSLDLNWGELSGIGAIHAITRVGIRTTVSPGAPYGTLTVDGIMAFFGTLDIDLSAPPDSPSGNDKLAVVGYIDTSAGTSSLNVHLREGFIPQIGDEFTIVTSDDQRFGVFGRFTFENLPQLEEGHFEVLYEFNAIKLRVVP